MLQGFIKSDSFGWVIFQHPANKVKETLMISVLAMHEFLKEKERKYFREIFHNCKSNKIIKILSPTFKGLQRLLTYRPAELCSSQSNWSW